ncbi:MAG: hypothetical protein QMD36_01335 [Candidatus Aenigmarchaeota archaeon]|nr:hypothetical protein [Candidatus Aenigmarchaeota archaeon]
MPDFDKLHFWFYPFEDGSDLYVYFDTGESWQTAGLACKLGGFKRKWNKYEVVLNPELNPNCKWTSKLRSVRYLLFPSGSTRIKIDGLYLCKNC